jgi:hypothetical protein
VVHPAGGAGHDPVVGPKTMVTLDREPTLLASASPPVGFAKAEALVSQT